jgi:hypothetical protein
MKESSCVVADVGIPVGLKAPAYFRSSIASSERLAGTAMSAGDDGSTATKITKEDGCLLCGTDFKWHVGSLENYIAKRSSIDNDCGIATCFAVIRGNDKPGISFADCNDLVREWRSKLLCLGPIVIGERSGEFTEGRKTSWVRRERWERVRERM